MSNLLRHTTQRILAIISMASILCACHIVPEQSEFMAVGDKGWLYGHSLRFHPDTALVNGDSIANADIAIAVRHSNGYEYSNIWVEMSYWGKDTLHTDTFNLRLADQFGRWNGTGIGVGYQYIDTVLSNTPIDLRHPIVLRHIMRADTLRDIEQAGIILNFK